MSDGFRTASVYVRDSFAGLLCEAEDGYVFTYDEGYLAVPDNPPVSLTLPRQAAPYRSAALFSFFDGLIPEGWLLEVVSHNWKVSLRDRFGLLLVSCRDCIGAVSIREGTP